jgi:hypothetical protein
MSENDSIVKWKTAGSRGKHLRTCFPQSACTLTGFGKAHSQSYPICFILLAHFCEKLEKAQTNTLLGLYNPQAEPSVAKHRALCYTPKATHVSHIDCDHFVKIPRP